MCFWQRFTCKKVTKCQKITIVASEEFECDSMKSLITLFITSVQYLFFLLQFFLCAFCLFFGDRISGYKKRLVEGDWDKNWLIWCLKMSHESWLVLFLLITHSMGGKTHENWNENFLQSTFFVSREFRCSFIHDFNF